MKIWNPDPIAAPSGAPPAYDPTDTYTYSYNNDKNKFYIWIEDAANTTNAITAAELEIHGYLTSSDNPGIICRYDFDSPTGRFQQPIVLDTTDIRAIYIRQGAQKNAIGGAGALNPAFKYQLVYDDTKKGV